MEGQDVARLATARDITDSYVEQGLEAELSVDLEGKALPATATTDRRGFDASQHAERGSGIPTPLARATDRRGEGIASSDAIVVLLTRLRRLTPPARSAHADLAPLVEWSAFAVRRIFTPT